MNCDIDANTLQCRKCGARVSSPAVRRNCAAFPMPPYSAEFFQPVAPPPGSPAARGPGTELKKLLSLVGITATETCPCNARARQMDEWGVEEASRPERIDQVVGWLRDEAQARGLPFVDMAGRMLVRRAIANARKAEARRAKEAEAAAESRPAV